MRYRRVETLEGIGGAREFTVDDKRIGSRLRGDAPAASTPASLLDRSELAFIAVERTRMPMVVTDPRQPDNPIVLANRAFLDLTGYGPDEVIGRNCRFLQGEATDPETVAEVRRAAAEGRECMVELLNYRKDGSAFWNRLFISPVRDSDGELIYYFASQQDISEQRRTRELEAAELRLLREIDHRAKNALALVQAIVRLSRADSAEAYAQAVAGRVDALANAHMMLSENGWRSVPITRLVAAEVARIEPDRLQLSGPELELSARQVQPLALLLHELIANAEAHGALSAPDGRLEIAWWLEPGSGEIVILLREAGGPPPVPTRVGGLGSTIVETISRRQLNGGVDFDWQPEGLISLVRVPHEALEPGPA